MQVSKMIVAGIGAALLAGGAMAAERAVHKMTVTLPDGSVEHIHYLGDQPPKIEIVPVHAAALPIAFLDPRASFAAFDQMFADMHMRQAAMMRQMAAIAKPPLAADGKVAQAAFGKLPAGTMHYSFVSTSSGNGTCTQSYQLTSYGANQAPKVVSRQSGDCSAVGKPPIPVSAPGAAVTPPKPAPSKAKLVDRSTV